MLKLKRGGAGLFKVTWASTLYEGWLVPQQGGWIEWDTSAHVLNYNLFIVQRQLLVTLQILHRKYVNIKSDIHIFYCLTTK